MIDDTEGQLETLRAQLLLPPQRCSGYPFHSTVVHPRTSAAGAACWARLRGAALDMSFTVRELLWTETDASTRRVLARFPLTGRPRASWQPQGSGP